MIKANVTISEGLISKLQLLQQSGHNDPIMRELATTMIAEVRERIHEKGLDSTGGKIGTYTPGYMKERTGNFGNATRYSRGKNKDAPKDAGVFTKGANKGQPRPRYNRTSDTMVVASLTRQMENDFKVVATDKGYGLGYSNEENYNKSQYVEATYDKAIFSLTAAEEAEAVRLAGELITKLLNQ